MALQVKRWAWHLLKANTLPLNYSSAQQLHFALKGIIKEMPYVELLIMKGRKTCHVSCCSFINTGDRFTMLVACFIDLKRLSWEIIIRIMEEHAIKEATYKFLILVLLKVIYVARLILSQKESFLWGWQQCPLSSNSSIVCCLMYFFSQASCLLQTSLVEWLTSPNTNWLPKNADFTLNMALTVVSTKLYPQYRILSNVYFLLSLFILISLVIQKP